MGRLRGRALPPRVGKPRRQSKTARRSTAATPAYKKWYYTARWRDLRQAVFVRDGFVCQATGILCIGVYPAPDAPVCDHKIPHRGNPAIFWDERNLQTVSNAYHVREKQRLEATGDLDPE